MSDPNPLATGPTKWRAELCVTHHHACDCREWKHAREVERLEAEVETLRCVHVAAIREVIALLDATASAGSDYYTAEHLTDSMIDASIMLSKAIRSGI